ncbi:pyocin knob domain-containing protein [Corynebacterium coyleae]|uniref:pyocin knob domain-containing protein n=1 Tax=Corynebacterium coyleae TaxID=53374 RepID=UPI00255100F1|nr:pyocin knob domain-containing protein [Corynebacterium coyleae]MDK8241737.1 pyocin knob domain-containing protein [Corynebacterium coyleae]
MALKKISQPVTELSTEDLNTVTQTGVYIQTANRVAERSENYPSNVAGLLEVHNGGSFVFQRYTGYKDFGIYTRSYYGYEGKWSPWRKILTE